MAAAANRTAPRPRSLRDESGQVIVLFAVALVVLVGMVGIVIDVGHAYYVQRSLQRSADAAALAGAASLPDAGAATAVARQYGATTGAANDTTELGEVSETISTKCLTSIKGCRPVNAVVVEERVEMPTMFLKALGFESLEVKTRSTACAPCGAKPLDIMLVLDRTGSMCQDHWGRSDPECTDLANAKAGMKTFLEMLDPAADHVGLAVLPPANGSTCAKPSTPYYRYPTDRYVVVPLSNDYLVDGRLDRGSQLVSTLDCVRGGGSTSYANALERAQDELDAHGRPDVQDLIVFFSDGAANTGPSSYPSTSPYRKTPCHQGIASAGTAKAKGTLVYSIGYDLDAADGGANICGWTDAYGRVRDEVPAITAYSALQQIASGPDRFYNHPSTSELGSLFEQVAYDVNQGASKLISNDTP